MRNNAKSLYKRLPSWFRKIAVPVIVDLYDDGTTKVIIGKIKNYKLEFRCQGTERKGWYSVEVKDDNVMTNVEVDIAKIINDKDRCLKIFEKVVEIKNILEGGKNEN